MPPVNRRAVAVTAVILYLAFSILIQIEDFALFLYRPADGWRGILEFAAQLPFRQAEHIAFAVGLGALAIPMVRWRMGRVAYLVLFGLLLLYLVFDQISFRTFFGHFDLARVDGRAAHGADVDSILAEIPWTLGPNLVIWIGAMAVMGRRMWRRSVPLAAARTSAVRDRPWTLAIGAAAYVGASVAVMTMTPASPLDREAIPVLLRSIFAATTHSVAPLVPDPYLYFLRFGTPTAAADTAGLSDEFDAIRRAAPQPNILFVIMESVGTQQLLPPSPRVTPTLARLADRTISFENLYNTFPASLRGHLPINTGGRTVTWSNFSGPAVDRYQGPVLVREMNRLGYRSALISAGKLVIENMEPFYRKLGFNHVYDPLAETEALRVSREVHSWGVDEDLARQRTFEWIDQGDRHKPFFVQFLTVSTHHPYGVAKGYTGPVSGDDDKARFLNAINYVDGVLGRLMADLDKRGLLSNTLIVICGDHGQAFGDIHQGNFFHQGQLFEENIRNFMVVLSPGLDIRGRRVSRIGSTGDIMPTIVSLAGGDPGDVPGQNLFASNYTERVAFFHKANSPRRWGLRDGQWKFSSSMTGTADAELYDLSADPQEQHNLASQFPQRIEVYQRACRQWYVETDHEYTARVEGYRESELSAADLMAPGPKRMKFGSVDAAGAFQELATINPREDVAAWTRWVPWPEGKRVFYRWTAPSGRQTQYSVFVKGGWGETWVHSEMIEPMEPGKWTLVIADLERELISATFLVSERAPLMVPMDPAATEPRPPAGQR